MHPNMQVAKLYPLQPMISKLFFSNNTTELEQHNWMTRIKLRNFQAKVKIAFSFLLQSALDNPPVSA